jgi:uncharacterized membrane protein
MIAMDGASSNDPRLPAWLRPTDGEHRWQAALVVGLIIVLQLAEPSRLTLHPYWLLPALEAAFLAFLLLLNPARINRESAPLRVASLTLAAAASFANAWSLTLLVHGLLTHTEGRTAGPLLFAGAEIWGANVIVFALWYWEFDRGGPVARAHAHQPNPDFLFPQMQTPDLVSRDWEPTFFDYLYVSYTNATAFSPTDTMPLSRWAKLLMLIQSAISLLTVGLVVARAVNILR